MGIESLLLLLCRHNFFLLRKIALSPAFRRPEISRPKAGLKARFSLFLGVATRHEGSSEKMHPSKAVGMLRSDLARSWNTTPSRQSGLADLMSAGDYEADEKSRRPRSDAKEQV
jgi:hypothetical protein